MPWHPGRDQAIEQFAFLAVNRVEQPLAVNGQADRFAHSDIPQNRGLGIEVEQQNMRSRADRRFHAWLFTQPLPLERPHGFDYIHIA